MKKDPVAVLQEVILALESAAGGKGKSLNAQSPCLARPDLATIRRTFWYDCVREVLKEAVGEAVTAEHNGSAQGGNREVVKWFFNTLDLDTDETGTEDQRLARAKAVKATIQLGKARAGLSKDTEWRAEMKGVVDKALGRERSLEVQKAWRECLELLK
jgi:proteasome component ECM29